MFTHRIDEESNWGGRGESTGVRGAKTRPSHFSVFNWLVRRVWDEKVPEKLRCEWKTSWKHRVNILTAGKHGKLVENHVLCWRCSCQARKGGKVFFSPDAGSESRSKRFAYEIRENLVENGWNCLTRRTATWRWNPPRGCRFCYLFTFLKIHFFEFLSIFDSARAKWHSRFFVFFVNQPHRHSLHLFTRKGILPHELIYILITLLRLENFRASFGIFSHFFPFLRFTFNFASKSVRK